MSFQVELSEFRGPLDLLLFLVRKHEVEIIDIPIAPITDQFLQYLEVLQELNVDDVGEFVEMASTLIEIKSRSVLPRVEEDEEPLEDPRQDLVRRLLEYKKFKDAASMLEERGRQWQQHFPRLSNDLAERNRDPAEEPIHEIEMWDLVSAFGRILREQRGSGSVEHRLRRHADRSLHAEDSRAVAGARQTFDFGIISGAHQSLDTWWACFWRRWNWCGITACNWSKENCSTRFGLRPATRPKRHLIYRGEAIQVRRIQWGAKRFRQALRCRQ